MRERYLIGGVVAVAMALSGCRGPKPKATETPSPFPTPLATALATETHESKANQIDTTVYVKSCLSGPDGFCEPGDPTVSGVSFIIGQKDGISAIPGITDENGNAIITGKLDNLDVMLYSEAVFSAEGSNGESVTLCSVDSRYDTNFDAEKNIAEVHADLLYMLCGPTSPLGDESS